MMVFTSARCCLVCRCLSCEFISGATDLWNSVCQSWRSCGSISMGCVAML